MMSESMAEKTVLICDVCGEGNAHRIEVHFEDGRLEVDLCDKHRSPLMDLKRSVPSSHFQKAGQRRKRKVHLDNEL